MLIFVRSYLSAYDARIQKYFRVMERLQIPFAFLGWRRDKKPYSAQGHEVLYERRSQLGARWANAFNIIGWNGFVFATLVKQRKNICVVHAVDLDSALICYAFCRLFGKAFIFDIYDKYSSVRTITGLTGRAIDAVERFIARKADLTLLAGEERLEQMRLPGTLANCLVLENVPLDAIAATPLPTFSSKWRIGYFGVLEPTHRGLEDLMQMASERSDIELHLAGYGGLEETVKAFASAHDSIVYHGPMGSAAGLKLMAQMHVTVGLYYLSVPNHAYAAPNKYYEHLMLARGLVTTKNTAPGRKVKALSTGWAVAEGKRALHTWLSELVWDDVEHAGRAAGDLWHHNYQHYFDAHYMAAYGDRVTDMLKINDDD